MNKLLMIISTLQSQRNDKKHISLVFRVDEKHALQTSHRS